MAALLALGLVASGALSSGELILRDWMLRLSRPRPALHVAAVLVDEDAIRRVGAWPWRRELLARLVLEISKTGASGLVLDLLLPEPREGDEALAEALAGTSSILAAGIDDGGRWLLPAPVLRGGARIAHVSFQMDRDGVVRRFFSTQQRQERSLPALSIAAAGLFDLSRAVPVGRALRPGFRARPDRIPALGAAAVLEGRAPARVLAGRVVFVGASAAGIGDRVMSPVSGGNAPDPGVLVQAAATEAILTGDLLRPAPPALAAAPCALVALASARLRRRLRLWALPGAFAVALLPLPLAYVSVVLAGVELPALAMTAACLLVMGALEVGATVRLRQEAATARRRIEELEAIGEAIQDERRSEAEARSVVAHELKTPLTSVRGLAQLLSGFDLSETERRRVAGMVVTETSRLATMVDALLDLERLKLRDFQKLARVVSLTGVVEERVALLRAGAGRQIDLDAQPSLEVLGDATLLGRVVDNLVANALKFSPREAPVNVAVRCVASEVVVDVADRGPGVPAGERRRIFERFVRGESASAAPGLGLGLALVAEVVAWHRGRVAVEPRAGGGSLFKVHIPLLPSAASKDGLT